MRRHGDTPGVPSRTHLAPHLHRCDPDGLASCARRLSRWLAARRGPRDVGPHAPRGSRGVRQRPVRGLAPATGRPRPRTSRTRCGSRTSRGSATSSDAPSRTGSPTRLSLGDSCARRADTSRENVLGHLAQERRAGMSRRDLARLAWRRRRRLAHLGPDGLSVLTRMTVLFAMPASTMGAASRLRRAGRRRRAQPLTAHRERGRENAVPDLAACRRECRHGRSSCQASTR